jgi:hypothetical protein
VWIWTKNKQVMTAAVERGWNTFIFPSNFPQLANDWSCMYFYSLSLIFSLYFKWNCFGVTLLLFFPFCVYIWSIVFAKPSKGLIFNIFFFILVLLRIF